MSDCTASASTGTSMRSARARPPTAVNSSVSVPGGPTSNPDAGSRSRLRSRMINRCHSPASSSASGRRRSDPSRTSRCDSGRSSVWMPVSTWCRWPTRRTACATSSARSSHSVTISSFPDAHVVPHAASPRVTMAVQLVVDHDHRVGQGDDARLGGQPARARGPDGNRREPQFHRLPRDLLRIGPLTVEHLDREPEHGVGDRRRQPFARELTGCTEADDEGAGRVRAVGAFGTVVDDDRLTDLLRQEAEEEARRQAAAEAGIEELARALERDAAEVTDDQRVGRVLEAGVDRLDPHDLALVVVVVFLGLRRRRCRRRARPRLRFRWPARSPRSRTCRNGSQPRRAATARGTA